MTDRPPRSVAISLSQECLSVCLSGSCLGDHVTNRQTGMGKSSPLKKQNKKRFKEKRVKKT
jgi:hypothetical protein